MKGLPVPSKVKVECPILPDKPCQLEALQLDFCVWRNGSLDAVLATNNLQVPGMAGQQPLYGNTNVLSVCCVIL